MLCAKGKPAAAFRRVDGVADKVKASIGDERFVYGDYVRALLS